MMQFGPDTGGMIQRWPEQGLETDLLCLPFCIRRRLTYVVCECVGNATSFHCWPRKMRECHQRDAVLDFCFVYCWILKPWKERWDDERTLLLDKCCTRGKILATYLHLQSFFVYQLIDWFIQLTCKDLNIDCKSYQTITSRMELKYTYIPQKVEIRKGSLNKYVC